MKFYIFLCIIASAISSGSSHPTDDQESIIFKIAGGLEVEPHSIPYQVSLQRDDHSPFCGGSILDEHNILTASHCLVLSQNSPIHVVAGRHDISILETTEQRIIGNEIIIHENFQLDSTLDDIGLIHLREPLVFNEFVSPVDLPKKGQEYNEGDIFQVSGWGKLSSEEMTSDTLQVTYVPYVTDEECRIAYDNLSIADSMLCAGAGGKDSCQGDSGGPMTIDGVIAGIVSWGEGCATNESPGVYTQVSYYTDWINEHKIVYGINP